MGQLAGLPFHDAHKELSSLQTPFGRGYPGELLGLEVWVRRHSQGLGIIFLYTPQIRACFPALAGLWTKVRCGLALWGAGGSSPGWFWAQQQQQGLPAMILGCWSGRAALAPLGWEKLCDARQPPCPTEEKQDRAEESPVGYLVMVCPEMLSIVSACPAARPCHPKGQETPTPPSSAG